MNSDRDMNTDRIMKDSEDGAKHAWRRHSAPKKTEDIGDTNGSPRPHHLWNPSRDMIDQRYETAWNTHDIHFTRCLCHPGMIACSRDYRIGIMSAEDVQKKCFGQKTQSDRGTMKHDRNLYW